MSGYINSVADWSRLGYKLDDAEMLADASQLSLTTFSMTHTMCGKTNDLFIKELLKSLRQLKVINKLWLTVCSDGVSISRNS